MSIDDLPWLVEYVRDELVTGGVALLTEEQEHGAAAVAAVGASNYNLRWDFNGKWSATVKAGPHRGLRMSSAVAKLDVAKWGKVQADHPDAEFAGVPFDEATHDHKKECTRLHLAAAVEAKLAEAGAGGGEGESKGDAPRTPKKSKCEGS